jgi:hypothetical protein
LASVCLQIILWLRNARTHDVLHRENEDIDNKLLRLSVWVSLLKKRTTFEKEKAEGRHKVGCHQQA